MTSFKITQEEQRILNVLLTDDSTTVYVPEEEHEAFELRMDRLANSGFGTGSKGVLRWSLQGVNTYKLTYRR